MAAPISKDITGAQEGNDVYLVPPIPSGFCIRCCGLTSFLPFPGTGRRALFRAKIFGVAERDA